MIKLIGQVKRSFEFPAELEQTFTYFSDVPRLIGYLPYITLQHQQENGDIRVRFSSTELASYQFNVICDFQVILDDATYVLEIRPVDNLPAIQPVSTANSTTARGYFACLATFTPAVSGHTQIDYTIEINGKVPRPKGLRFMPGAVINRVAKSIANGRLKEIADGFVENTTEAFLAQSV